MLLQVWILCRIYGLLYLYFFWSIPFAFILGKLSLFYNDEFLGIWIRSPQDYPLSYSIFLSAIFSCSAILNWILGNIKSYSKLLYILLGIFSGSLLNIFLVIFGFVKSGYYFYFIFVLIFIYFIPQDWVEFLPAFIFSAALFVYLSKKIEDIKDKILLAILIVTLPFLPLIILPLVGCYFVDRLSSANRRKLSLLKKILLGNFQIALIILCFVGIIKSDRLPGLIVSPHLRYIWGTTFNYPLNGYEKAIEKLYNCQSIKNKIEEIKSISLTEGKNYTLWDIPGSAESTYLNIQIIGEDKQAFVKGCFNDSYFRECFFGHHGAKKEDQNKAKVVSETEVKTIDVLECL